MAAPEGSKYRLQKQFEEGLGPEMSTVLMEYLDTFATKADLEPLATKADLETAMSSLELRMYRALLTTFLVMIGTNAAMIALLR